VLLGLGRLRDRAAPALKISDQISGKIRAFCRREPHNPALGFIELPFQIWRELAEGPHDGDDHEQKHHGGAEFHF